MVSLNELYLEISRGLQSPSSALISNCQCALKTSPGIRGKEVLHFLVAAPGGQWGGVITGQCHGRGVEAAAGAAVICNHPSLTLIKPVSRNIASHSYQLRHFVHQTYIVLN